MLLTMIPVLWDSVIVEQQSIINWMGVGSNLRIHDWRHRNFSLIKKIIHQGLEEIMLKKTEYNGPTITGLHDAKGSNGI